MIAIATIASCAFFFTALVVALTWGKVSFRRCECSEEIARIENDKPPKQIGITK